MLSRSTLVAAWKVARRLDQPLRHVCLFPVFSRSIVLFHTLCLVFIAVYTIWHVHSGTLEQRQDGYLLYSTRYDGFNNQLDQVRFAICSAYRYSRTLVALPMWYEWNWNSMNKSAHADFGEFFDLGVLSQLVPVVEYREFQRQREQRSHPVADILCYKSGEKEEILNMTAYALGVVCSEHILKGPIEAVSLFDSLPEICGDYGSSHSYRRGMVVQNGTMHGMVSMHLTWSTKVHAYADGLIEQNTKPGGHFVAIHLRLGDYREEHCQIRTFCPEPKEIADCLQVLVATEVFLATNPEELVELKHNLAQELIGMNMTLFSSTDADDSIPSHLVSVVEQAVSSKAVAFVGMNSSSWSQFVFDVRDAQQVRHTEPMMTSLTWQQCQLLFS